MNEILLFTVIACFGMLVQSTVGFAGSLLAIPLFSLFLSPRQAVPTYNLVMLLIDLYLVIEARKYIQWNRVNRLLVGGLVGTPIGAYGLAHLPCEWLRLVISTVTLVFAVLFLFKVRIHLRETMPTQVGVGLLSGLLGGSISESGPPVVVYGLARNWDKDAFRTTLLTYFFCLALVANLSFWYLGLFTVKSLHTFTVAVVPMLAAAWLGVILKNRISETVFRYAVLGVIILVSLLGFSHKLTTQSSPSSETHLKSAAPPPSPVRETRVMP